MVVDRCRNLRTRGRKRALGGAMVSIIGWHLRTAADGGDAQSAIPGVEKWGVGYGKTKWNNQCEFCNEGGTLEMCYGCNLVCHKECAEEVGA